MRSLPLFLDMTGRAVILLGDGEAAAAKRRLLERAGARIVGEAEGAALAIVALDDDEETAAAITRLRSRGILANAVDRPELCDFTLPAIVDRSPVLLAIGTGGVSAGLAKALRQRLEALLPTTLGRLAEALHAARPTIRARWPEAAARRRAIDAALQPGGALDPLRSAESISAWLDAATDAAAPSQVVHIRLRSDDPDDLTLREARLLAGADRVYHAPSVPAAVVDRARADAARHEGDPPSAPPPGLSVALSYK